MRLIDVYEEKDSPEILWKLLEERTKEQSISHKAMPSWAQHIKFILSQPYQAWYFIEDRYRAHPGYIVGTIYLTKNSEIGISIFNRYQGRGYGSEAIRLLVEKEGHGKYFANVAPGNEPSHKLWEKLGGKVIQHTYELTL